MAVQPAEGAGDRADVPLVPLQRLFWRDRTMAAVFGESLRARLQMDTRPCLTLFAARAGGAVELLRDSMTRGRKRHGIDRKERPGIRRAASCNPRGDFSRRNAIRDLPGRRSVGERNRKGDAASASAGGEQLDRAIQP
jgi:hypothetical protein